MFWYTGESFLDLRFYDWPYRLTGTWCDDVDIESNVGTDDRTVRVTNLGEAALTAVAEVKYFGSLPEDYVPHSWLWKFEAGLLWPGESIVLEAQPGDVASNEGMVYVRVRSECGWTTSRVWTSYWVP